jgi:hypothetical protein
MEVETAAARTRHRRCSLLQLLRFLVGARGLGHSVTRTERPRVGISNPFAESPPTRNRLPPQDDVHSREHEFQLLLRYAPDPLREQRAVECDDLRDVGNRVLGQAGAPSGQEYVSWCAAPLRLLVSGTQTTVARRLLLSDSPCTTRTGRRNPGPDPTGSGRSAQQTSPWAFTTRIAPAHGARHSTRTGSAWCPPEWPARSWPSVIASGSCRATYSATAS